MNKVKLTLIAVTSFVLASCALGSSVPLSDRIARLEATYTGALEILTENRKICVENPQSDQCIVDDDVARQIEPIREKLASTINKAETYVEVGDEEQARTLYEEAVAQFAQIKDYVDDIKGLIGAN